ECVALANKLIIECQLEYPRVSKLSHIKPHLVMLLFKACCGIDVQGTVENPTSLEDEACNVQAMLEVLSRDVLFMSLAHISGRDVVSKNAVALLDLLEILEGCWGVRSASSSSPPSTSSLSTSPSWLPGSTSGASEHALSCRHSSITSGTSDHSSSTSDSWKSLNHSDDSHCFFCRYVAAKEQERDDARHNFQQSNGLSKARVESRARPQAAPNIQDELESRALPRGQSRTQSRSGLPAGSHAQSAALPRDYSAAQHRTRLLAEPKVQSRAWPRARYESGAGWEDDQGVEAHLSRHGSQVSPSLARHPRRLSSAARQSSPYWLRGTADPDAEPTPSDVDEERLAASIAELRQLLAQSEADNVGDRGAQKRPRVVKKSVLLSPSLHRAKRKRTESIKRPPRPEHVKDVAAEDTSPDVVTDDGSADVSPHVERLLHKLHEQHVRFATGRSASDVAAETDQLERKQAELLRRHTLRMEQLRKDLAHAQRMNELDTQRQLHLAIEALEKERRQRRALLKRHAEERERIIRSRRTSQQHREQQIFRGTFKESIQAQKADLQDVRKFVRERSLREKDSHRVHLASLENFYQSQLSLLTESLSREKQELRARATAQSQVLDKMRREFREKLEEETRNMYDMVARTQNGWVATGPAVRSRRRSQRI
ncbi:unnamed protein product, partial [Ixodes hexagonus]